MKRILITGATGNVGFEVISSLFDLNTLHEVYAGVRNVSKSMSLLNEFPELKFKHFDFEQPETFEAAFTDIDAVFLLRPPHISDTELYFKPLIAKMKEKGVREIIFLSVQGADKSKIIPHNRIEHLINGSEMEYIFLRPSYFMQNLTTTLLSDIKFNRKIILPSGRAKFNWIDVKNIGETAATLFERFSEFKNQAFDLTGYENINFNVVAELISQVVDYPVIYKSVSPFRFYRIKKKEGMVKGMILVMMMLHFIPRFQNAPRISKFYQHLSGKEPTPLISFIEREKDKFSS
jgi:uncharacterized protein YbjT (DUF2867 family)